MLYIKNKIHKKHKNKGYKIVALGETLPKAIILKGYWQKVPIRNYR